MKMLILTYDVEIKRQMVTYDVENKRQMYTHSLGYLFHPVDIMG